MKVLDRPVSYSEAEAEDGALSDAEAARAARATSLPRKAFQLLASYELSCAILFFLFLLTLLGTLYQVDNGLYAAQEKYFSSLALVHRFNGVPVPLPGGKLLLALLFANLLCGAIVTARKGWSRVGILTAHAGVLLLLAGAFITYRFSQEGEIVLYEREQAGFFELPRAWELIVTERTPGGDAKSFAIPAERFEDADGGRPVVFAPRGTTWEIAVSDYLPDAVPRLAEEGDRAVDGFSLKPVANNPNPAAPSPGAYVTLRDRPSGQAREGIVWAREQAPWQVSADGREWTIHLRKRRMPLPFTLVLERFSRELHPRTAVAKAYESEVTKLEGDRRQTVRISMNEPLRSNGYTVYQASWGPQDARPGTRLYSVLAVTRNPAERFPLYACIVFTFGMALHFTLRLLRHLRAEGRRAA